MNTKHIFKLFPTAIFTGLIMLALFGISALTVSAQTKASITVKKDVCNSIGQNNTCNGNNRTLDGQTINFSVTPSGTTTSIIPVVIKNGAGQTTVKDDFVEGITYRVCELNVPTGFDSIPQPDQSTGGSSQSADGDCLILVAGPGNNVAQFVNVVVNVGPTAATAMIAGRVTTDSGFVRGSGRLLVTVLNTLTLETQSVFTNRLGYYEFNDLPVGATYILSVRGKGYSFTPQTFTLSEDSALDMFGFAVNRSDSKGSKFQ